MFVIDMIRLLDVERAQRPGRRVTGIIQNRKKMVCYGTAPFDFGRRETPRRFPSPNVRAAQQRQRQYKHSRGCKG